MLRPALFAGFCALAAAAPAALTLTVDAPVTVVRPATGTIYLMFTGVIDNSSVSTTAQATSASVYSLSASPAGFTKASAAISDSVLGNFKSGTYTGNLFSLPISATTTLGAYAGTVVLQLKFGSRASAVLTSTAPFSFTVAQSVPEPAGLTALAVGLGAATRRRRG